MDLDGDELIDLAVGAQGSAVMLRWVEEELGREEKALPEFYFYFIATSTGRLRSLRTH